MATSGVKLTGDVNVFKRTKLAYRSRMRSGGERLVASIVERTRRGESSTGTRFIRYSQRYAEQKGVGTNEVDLTASGDMLDSLTVVKAEADSIVIGWRSDKLAERASALEDSDKAPRPFLDVDDDQLDALVDWVEDGIEFGS